MLMLLLSTLVAILIPAVVFIAAWFLASRTLYDREKSSPFECGFDPNLTARIPFSLRFFLLAIIFIVFDIEIVLLIPIPMLSYITSKSAIIAGGMLFLIILILGLLHEWNEGSLDWSM